ncbi:hypothetical protein ACJJTC_012480 [Scirpophaga incertulas]
MFLAGIDTYSSTMRTVAIEQAFLGHVVAQGSSNPGRHSTSTLNHQSFTPPFETAVKRQTYEPLFISFQKYYNRIDDRDGGDNHQSVTADTTSVVCEAARDKVGALLY